MKGKTGEQVKENEEIENSEHDGDSGQDPDTEKGH